VVEVPARQVLPSQQPLHELVVQMQLPLGQVWPEPQPVQGAPPVPQ